jgi:hypothetical protein
MKGGVKITNVFYNQYKPDDNVRGMAFDFFLNNSTFRILTNSSISCITLISELNPGVVSPYVNDRANVFNVEVRRLLLKIFLTHPTTTGWYDIPNRTPNHDGIEIQSYRTFLDEARVQIDLFRQSYIDQHSLFDAICPEIVYIVQNWNNAHNINIIPQNDQNQLNDILRGANLGDNTISVIAMELMEGFDIAANILPNLDNDRRGIMYKFIQYELTRMHLFGYRHNDFHQGNVLINPNYRYFTRSGQIQMMGRVIIIDFGRSTRIPARITQDEHDRILVDDLEHMLDNNYLSMDEFNGINTMRERYLNDITFPALRHMFPSNNYQEFHQNVVRFINNMRLGIFNVDDIVGGESMKKIEHKNQKKYNSNKTIRMNKNIENVFKLLIEKEDQIDVSLFVKDPISQQNFTNDEFKNAIIQKYYNFDVVKQLEKYENELNFKKSKNSKTRKSSSNKNLKVRKSTSKNRKTRKSSSSNKNSIKIM